MANGAQIAQVNYYRFLQWKQSMTDAGFRTIERRGVINRAEIVKQCGFARSALTQNPRIKAALKELEDELRARAILPTAIDPEGSGNRSISQANSPERVSVSDGLDSLTTENAALVEENRELKRKLSKLAILQEALVLTGRIPR